MRLTIYGTLPGMNECLNAANNNRYQAARLKSGAERLVMIYARRDLKRWRAKSPVYMRYTWYEPNRKRDKSNICGYGRKVIEDALVKLGYLRGDGWAHIVGFSDNFAVDKARPRIEVEIEEVTGNEARGH